MGREYKKRRKSSRKIQKSARENLQKGRDQHRNPLGERTNRIPPHSPSKVIKRLRKENKVLQKKAEASTQRYWNARRRTLRLEKAAAARKVDLKQAKFDANRLRGVVNVLGKSLEDFKKTANDTTSLLQASFEHFLTGKLERHSLLLGEN